MKQPRGTIWVSPKFGYTMAQPWRFTPGDPPERLNHQLGVATNFHLRGDGRLVYEIYGIFFFSLRFDGSMQ